MYTLSTTMTYLLYTALFILCSILFIGFPIIEIKNRVPWRFILVENVEMLFLIIFVPYLGVSEFRPLAESNFPLFSVLIVLVFLVAWALVGSINKKFFGYEHPDNMVWGYVFPRKET